MITAQQQSILDYVEGRLLANRREYRWIREDGMFNVGWLARCINLGLLHTSQDRMGPELLATMVADVTPLDQSDLVGAFASLTLAAPCLAYRRPNGRTVLLDGLKRARQAFAQGHSHVPIAIIELEDAQRYGMSAEYRAHWRALEATEYHPIGAREKRNFDKAIVEFQDDREAKKPLRGQPRFSVQQNALAASATYYLVALIELEFYICENHPASALIGSIQRRLDRSTWVEAFLLELYRTGRIPVAQSASEVADRTGSALERMGVAGGRAGLKRQLQAHWKRMSPEAVVADRDALLNICAAVIKVNLRFRLRQTYSRALVRQENGPQSMVYWRDVRSIVEAPDPQRQADFELSRLSFDEQLMVTHVTGVNMNEVYHDHTNRDPLFEAFAFAFAFGTGGQRRALADPCMIETVVHRRAMSILGQRDGMTDCWEDLFDHWRHRSLDDAVLIGLIQQVDAASCWNNAMEILSS